MLGEFLSAIFDVSVRAGADVRQERRRHEANSRAASPRGRRVLGIKDWTELCDFIYGLDDNWLEELLQERKRQRSRGQWNTGGPIATARNDDSTTQTYPSPDKWNFSPQRPEPEAGPLQDEPEAGPLPTHSRPMATAEPAAEPAAAAKRKPQSD